jgi:hypothetical protein
MALTALAFADVAAGPITEALARFDAFATRYPALAGAAPSPVSTWRRLVAAAATQPEDEALHETR